VKAGVWCAVSARKIVLPVFFNETINFEKYLRVERTVFSTVTASIVMNRHTTQSEELPINTGHMGA
jgi:hypothetical protein